MMLTLLAIQVSGRDTTWCYYLPISIRARPQISVNQQEQQAIQQLQRVLIVQALFYGTNDRLHLRVKKENVEN